MIKLKIWASIIASLLLLSACVLREYRLQDIERIAMFSSDGWSVELLSQNADDLIGISAVYEFTSKIDKSTCDVVYGTQEYSNLNIRIELSNGGLRLFSFPNDRAVFNMDDAYFCPLTAEIADNVQHLIQTYGPSQ